MRHFMELSLSAPVRQVIASRSNRMQEHVVLLQYVAVGQCSGAELQLVSRGAAAVLGGSSAISGIVRDGGTRRAYRRQWLV